MSIRCQCMGCSARFDAPDTLAGKAVRCPKCKAAIRLPGTESNPTPAAKPKNTAQPRPTQKDSASKEPLWSVRDTEGLHRGPMPKVELDRLVATDQLDGLCQIRRADWEDWRWIETVYEKFAETDVPAADDVSVENNAFAENDFADTELSEAAGPRLQECPDCGKIVSHRATQCPNCGCPVIKGAKDRSSIATITNNGGVQNDWSRKNIILVILCCLFLPPLLLATLFFLLVFTGVLGFVFGTEKQPVEIQLPLPASAPVAPIEPLAVEPATPKQIEAWIYEVAAQTARNLDDGYRQMHLAQAGIAAMQDQAELIDSLVSGEFAKSAKHDKPKRQPPPPYKSRYEPLYKECAAFLRQNVGPKTTSRAEVVKQATRWADTKRSPMQKALETQIGVPTR